MLNRVLKAMLGYAAETSDAEIIAEWDHKLSTIGKPCEPLEYCPYGPLVEGYPLVAMVEEGIDEVQARLIERNLADGRYDAPQDWWVKGWARGALESREPAIEQEVIPAAIELASCPVFGHMCPVYFSAERFEDIAATIASHGGGE
jgi:hypothetical protein